jgi:hypothetical protein
MDISPCLYGDDCNSGAGSSMTGIVTAILALRGLQPVNGKSVMVLALGTRTKRM